MGFCHKHCTHRSWRAWKSNSFLYNKCNVHDIKAYEKNNEILHLKGNSSYCKRVIYVHLLLDVCLRPASFSTTTQTCHQCELSTTLYECTFAISRNLCCVNHAIKLLVALLARNYSYSPPPLKQKSTPPPSICDMTIKFANLVLERLFITNLYQLDKQSSKFTI